MPTLARLVDEYLKQHTAEANTLRTLAERLKYATRTFGEIPVDRLDPQAIGAWRKQLPDVLPDSLDRTRSALDAFDRVGTKRAQAEDGSE